MDFNMVWTLRRLRESIATLKYSCFRAKCDKNQHENHLIHPSARLLQRSLEDAKKNRDEIAAIIATELYQLLHCNWRAMRAEEFEQFLCRVFVMLGYQAQLTKRSHDQGVDLIITGKGKIIAVQAKGYASSVGNHSVGEVVAGMAFHGCDTCVVITNSYFTSTAKKLAIANNCRLIDDSEIPKLIEGLIY